MNKKDLINIVDEQLKKNTQQSLLEFNKKRIAKDKSEKKNKKVRVIDLFAGIGGIRIGFESVFNNIEVVFTSEIDKHAQQTYIANFGNKINGDITKIDADKVPSHDILLAGFPCQAFSLAGLKRGFDDTRGTLFFDVARIAALHRPSVIFLENVKGFKNHDKGRTFQIVRKALEDLEYKVFAGVLNSKHFGVPQNRERIFLMCFQDQEIEFDFDKLKNIEIESRLGDILQKNPDVKYTLSDKLWLGHQKRKARNVSKGYGFGYSLFNEDSKYTSTISARYYKDGSEILIHQEGINPRKLTPREAARLQGFPENFKIPKSDVQAYKQFGNSVSVPVIQVLANEIKKLNIF